MTKPELKIIRVSGEKVIPYIYDLAQLRIHIFRNYPYLYNGDMEFETKYLSTYVKSPNTAVFLVMKDDQVVGATTAIPLKEEVDTIKQLFIDHGYDINRIFYLGESVLLEEYRGQGIGRRFFEEREKAAKEQGYDMTTFAAVKRPENHPLRPDHWHPLDELWKSVGYVKHPELVTFYSWKEHGESMESEKPMEFWIKAL